MKNEVDRRRMFLAGACAALGAALIPEALAQEGPQSGPVRPVDAGGIHEDMVSRIGKALGREDLNSKEGLFIVISLLQESGLINEVEAAILRELVDVIFSARNIDTLEKAIDAIYQKAKTTGKSLSIAITSIAVSSLQFAKQEFRTHKRAIYIVSEDVRSALLGAAGCLKLGPVWAVVGALAGAVAGSSTAAYASEGKG